MSNLNEKDINRLRESHPKRKYLRYIFLAIGLLVIMSGFIFLIIGYDFKVDLEGINLSLFIDILIILFGGVLVSKFFIAPYYLRENSIVFKKMQDLREPVKSYVKFTSITISRLIASLLLVISGIVSLIIFGTDVGHEVKYGSAISLGGPSWFYLTGLPMLGIGLGLMLYFFLSPFRAVFSKSNNFFFFYEIRPGFPWLTEIPKKDIEAIRYQNNHLGPKLSWIILLIPFIVQQLMTAVPLFFAERAAPSFTLSWIFLLISILELIALALLVIFPQNYFEIATSDRLYEMWFSPLKLKNITNFKEDFSKFLECNPEYSKIDIQDAEGKFSRINTSHFQLFKMIFGIFLIISAVLMLTQMILFGPLVWWISLLYGIITLVKSSFFDFFKNKGNLIELNENLKSFKFKRVSSFKFQYIMANKLKSVGIRKWFRKLDFFDFFGISGMLIFLTIQQTQGWIIADTLNLISENVISTIYMILVVLFILIYLCLPIDVIEFSTPSIRYQIETTLKKQGRTNFIKYLSSFKSSIKEVLKPEMRKTFWLRISLIISLITGSLLYMLYYLILFY